MNAQKIGKLIYKFRTKKNLTQKDLADLVNVTDKAVSKWERGDGCPDVSIMPKLADALGMNVENLMSGEMPSVSNSTTKKIRIYDFARPTFLSKYQMRELCNVGEKFATVMTEKIFSMIGEKIQMSISSVDELSNLEFLHSIPERTFIYNFDYNNGGFCLELDPQIGKLFLKQNIERYQKLTTLDAKMLGVFFASEIATAFLQTAYDQTNKSIPFSEFELKKREGETITNPAFIPYQYPSNVCGLIRFRCKAEGVDGFINIQLSDGFIEKLFEMNFFGAKNNSPIFQRLQNIKNKIAEPNLLVEFGRFTSENVSPEKGKIFIFDKKKAEGLNVIYKNKIIHTGEVVAIEESFGVRILEDKLENEIVYDEKEYLSVQLGARFLSEEDASNLKQGSIVELNTIAGNPSAIIQNERTIAEGEIVIVDDNFGIRVTSVF